MSWRNKILNKTYLKQRTVRRKLPLAHPFLNPLICSQFGPFHKHGLHFFKFHYDLEHSAEQYNKNFTISQLKKFQSLTSKKN